MLFFVEKGNLKFSDLKNVIEIGVKNSHIRKTINCV